MEVMTYYLVVHTGPCPVTVRAVLRGGTVVRTMATLKVVTSRSKRALICSKIENATLDS